MAFKAIVPLLLISGSLIQPSFKEQQMRFTRVAAAYREKETVVRQYFAQKAIAFSGFHLFIRGFKDDRKLEVWVRGAERETWTLLHSYPFCASSGTLGPKRREGDGQIPEGIYAINHFNPQSNFYLSLGLNYPNRSDRLLGDPSHPGGSIYMHGNCVTIGCIPITDEGIKELYVTAVEACNNGQTSIPVHIFPSRLTKEGLARLKAQFAGNAATITLWENLQVIYEDFEDNRRLRPVIVNARGLYSLARQPY